ncbi:hypothetical protein ENUP19_0219G0048 [Entamoeba nuttalli]|uniref:20 kDa antigen, putative n=2 Tax=Entamoeba nuttalli TaxID=412467 RepID=K2GRZ3_ENTNP|nr:20 kDa antigen, putative [Entamoeba nuttalli P19]EKE37728.1 20 kDa antigen, putative [Entamoeba nuttalli P19]|eukprot:XP_008859939.1 20 kDa antigen, putative [Entamoeba nuttalli P19]
MRARMVGPGSSSSNYKSTTDPCRFMGCGPSSSTSSGYRKGGNAAGPMASKGTWAATTDIGKTAAVGADTYEAGYRKGGNAAGPMASKGTWAATTDIGITAGVGADTYEAGYRRGADAAGPMASKGTWAATTDSGITAPCSGTEPIPDSYEAAAVLAEQRKLEEEAANAAAEQQ